MDQCLPNIMSMFYRYFQMEHDTVNIMDGNNFISLNETHAKHLGWEPCHKLKYKWIIYTLNFFFIVECIPFGDSLVATFQFMLLLAFHWLYSFFDSDYSSNQSELYAVRWMYFKLRTFSIYRHWWNWQSMEYLHSTISTE